VKNSLIGSNFNDMSDKDKVAYLLEQIKLDPLTGIYNKHSFLEGVENLLNDNPDRDYDLVCLSIVTYGLLLERYGQKKCDISVKNITNMVKGVIPKDSILGKVDEHQLAFLVPSKPYNDHVRDANLCQQMAGEASISGIAVKCGIYQHVDHSLSPEVMLHNAEMAVESIHATYGVNVCAYDTAIREKVSKEQFITENMAAAIRKKQFIVYYQPKFSIKGEKINGAEALVRWIHPEAGFMNPGEFIPIFEHNGFIQELDKYMLKAVCTDIRGWLDRGMKVVPISVNVSQTNFDNRNLAKAICEIVDANEVPRDLIHFEITESTNATDFEKKLNIIKELKEAGFKIELDDFGSGYSSLSTLCDIPIDIVKLDMSLVKRMFEKKHSAVLSGALFTARELGLNVVAEGIETKEQVEEIKFRANYFNDFSIQGFYYSKPVPKIQFEKYLWEKEEDSNEYTYEENVQSSTYNRNENDSAIEMYDSEIQTQKYRALMEVPGTVTYEYEPLSDRMILEIQQENGVVIRRSSDKYLESLPLKHWIFDDDVQGYIEAIRDVIKLGDSRFVQARAITRNGGYQTYRYHFAPIKNDSGAVIRVVGRAEISEIQERRHNDIATITATFRYKNDSSQKFAYVSENAVKMLGFKDEDEFRKFYNNSFINFVYEEDRQRVIREISHQAKEDYVDYCEYRVKKANGDLIWIYDKGTIIVDENGVEYFYVTIMDLDEYKSREIHKQRTHDKMNIKYKSESRQDKVTGLDNKDYSLKLIQKYLDSKDRGTFFLVDIDGFKQINDLRGHLVGDKVLSDFAELLKKAFRDGDILGRYGGDEFLCYMPGICKKNVAERKALDMLNRASKVKVNENESLSISVGIVIEVLKAKDVNDLVDMAEKALNDTRKKGVGNYSFY